jgi:hypothetical protein
VSADADSTDTDKVADDDDIGTGCVSPRCVTFNIMSLGLPNFGLLTNVVYQFPSCRYMDVNVEDPEALYDDNADDF